MRQSYNFGCKIIRILASFTCRLVRIQLKTTNLINQQTFDDINDFEDGDSKFEKEYDEIIKQHIFIAKNSQDKLVLCKLAKIQNKQKAMIKPFFHPVPV